MSAEFLTDGIYTLRHEEEHIFIFSRNDENILENISPDIPIEFYRSFVIKKMINISTDIAHSETFNNDNISIFTLTQKVYLETINDGLAIKLVVHNINEKNDTYASDYATTEKQDKQIQVQVETTRIPSLPILHDLYNYLNCIIKNLLKKILG